MTEGERLGKYLVRRKLKDGQWLGERMEDFEQEVVAALIPDAATPAEEQELLERRQRLAMIEHPAIPRLIGSGETVEGRGYALFEHVPAAPVLALAREQHWSLRQSVKFALGFLDGLALAHKLLVAHGGLRAESFRATPAGEARLTAFPIASPGSAGAAEDISAAAALLSSLFAVPGDQPLPRDLQAILHKAHRDRAGQGYDSAHALAEDLRQYLKGKPVSARTPTLAYRGAMFARRKPLFSSVAAAVFLVVVATAAYSVAKDAAAQRSRNQAQQRLRQLQRLTYSLESNLYQPVSALPNSDAARHTLIEWTSESLDSLAAQAAGDKELAKELGRAYNRLAELQRANGDSAAAAVSQVKSLAVVGSQQPRQ